jgi:hypothetical protein
VTYDRGYSFLGFYIVRPAWRGRGFGLRMWRKAIAHAGGRVIGLDGVVAQQPNYRASGFALSHRNIRFGGKIDAHAVASQDIVLSQAVPLDNVVADDASVFPASRESFLAAWIGSPGHIALGLRRDGRLAAWGVIRPCRIGHKIGPLVGDGAKAVEALLLALVQEARAGHIFLDVPEPNHSAVALAQAYGLAPVFETARMYRGPMPILRLDRLFGVTTFELG